MCVRIRELRESLCGYAARFDAAVLSAAQAAEVLEQATRIENAAATLKAMAAARVAEAGAWRAGGDRSAAHHLARSTGTTVARAASVLGTARRLGELPQTSAAARRGELSAEAAAAIAGAAGVAGEGELLEAARRLPLSELRQECARARAAADDTEARRRRLHQRRSLRSYTDAEGEWHMHCRDNPEVGARIMAALDHHRDQVFRRARAEGCHEPTEAYAADALAEMARLSLGAAVGDAGAGDAGAGDAGAGNAGAGNAGAGNAAGVGDGARSGSRARPSAPARAGVRPKIIVRVDLGALLRGHATEGEVCEIAGFGPVAVSAVREMIDSGDPFLAAVATRGQKLLGVAHLGRRPTAGQQTALQWLYPSCANQACAARAHLDYDHRLDWAATHFTVLDLLDRLCGHCHALKTRQNWSLVEGRGKRAFVAPGDSRHPRHAPEPRVNGPP